MIAHPAAASCTGAPQAEAFASGLANLLLVLLVAVVGVSSFVHHFRPALLAVPPSSGVPRSTPAEMLAADVVVIALAGLCYVHARERFGTLLATAFLVGSFVFTGIEETMWILIGRFTAGGTYHFTRGFFWFLETPVSACLGWFVLAYATMWVAELVFPAMAVCGQAAVAGLMALDLDLWIDPVQTHPALRAWVWADQPGGLWVLSIPVTNFIGWFLLIFLFALVFDRLPGWVGHLGAGRALGRFFAALLALELGIFALFVCFGAVEQRLMRPKLNLTLWGL